jgi:molybdenum cofactor synthesis domain-containing protein
LAYSLDIATNEVVLQKYDRLGPAEIGLLATVGVSTVPVFKVPKIAVISTGDELDEPEAKLQPGHIRDSNRSMLLTAIKEADPAFAEGCLDLGIVKDTEEDIKKKITEALNVADIVISTGGVSMGELDLMQPILQKTGKIHFGRVLMKPGKPLTFATVEGTLYSN